MAFTRLQLRNLTNQELMRLLPQDNPEVAELVRRLEELTERLDLFVTAVDGMIKKSEQDNRRVTQ